MKKLTLLFTALVCSLLISAQQLKIEKNRSLLYITHTVAAKETLFSLSRLYHVSHKEIAQANKLEADAGLQLNQEVKIPLTKSNFVQSDPKSRQGLKPLYHSVKKGESLAVVSASYNKVNPELLKKWNKLPAKTLKPGQDIIVGYIRKNIHNTIPEAPKTSVAKAPQKPAKEEQLKEVTAVPQAAQPQAAPTRSETEASNDIIFPLLNNQGSHFEQGFMINTANKVVKNVSGVAATFKSTSGWNDGKYYILVNGIEPETIVRVSMNGNSIYAKVLEALPEMRHNKALLCRLSSAAAAALGINDGKFKVELSYYE